MGHLRCDVNRRLVCKLSVVRRGIPRSSEGLTLSINMLVVWGKALVPAYVRRFYPIGQLFQS